LAAERRLNARDVAKQFGCSVKTAQRDLAALRDEEKIEFVGAARTGYYRLRPPREAAIG
jgi:predicted DNA-binding transcriptional regulator YafY